MFGSLQIWYDDPESCEYKYKMASEMGLRGVGFWHLDTLAQGAGITPVQGGQTAAMWKAVETFIDNGNEIDTLDSKGLDRSA